ncbi:LOG family protein [Luteipulveratus halotolerans]|uniref:Rossmann fold nucleotide-binding protein n=1 Tax=Luteipulveratus halotolerans TaxID=1631356 RepID=A0A0L6CIL2_9MICO|nr:LOG family protein [Luteipulveratus halotolerans]KNX37564.1 Rossmann fold nucleotide-binding protein [Luteipulveratus halotolerans]
MPTTEIESLDQLDAVLRSGRSLQGLRLQGLDLTGDVGERLLAHGTAGVVVLGGVLTPRLEHELRAQGATIFPTDPSAPVDPYRARLYAPTELYDGLLTDGYDATPDARAYVWSQDADSSRDAYVTLLRAIHDHSMSDSLDELLEGRHVVGVMGGHAVERGTPAYADAARLGHDLAEAGLLVATGGGPGAMEAANLGAACADPTALDAALAQLAAVPSFRPSVQDWARSASDVRAAYVDPHDGCRSIGVPTWFYGHEPPNLFADAVAKFFSNALREDILLARCDAGVVVLPGAAGTVQEIFQLVTRLYYAREGTQVAPLALVGKQHWSETVPVWPALEALGRDRALGRAIHLVDSTGEAAELVTASGSGSDV